MEYLNISTTQNVNIEYQLASVGDRIFAYIIDGFIQIFAVVAIILIFIVGLGIESWWLALLFLPLMFYHLLCEAFLNGQSFGKMMMKIKATKIDGSELRFIDCFLRWIFRIVDFNLPIGGALVGLLTIIIGGKGQRIGDIVAKTTVIKVGANVGLQATAYVEVEDDYIPQYASVAVLSERDVLTIKEVLNRVESARSNRNGDASDPLVVKTTEVVSRKMNVEPTQTAGDFLRTVLKDYNFYHR
ncbi:MULTISPECIES: RDD family protein [unclassified Carboxylicivirga]|uniref:RDD family protein n=1 Tax=Carboxylicivirga TaxID=1628153 RepID=UPI003D343A21